LQDALDADHAWRVKELANLRLAVRSDASIGQTALIRAGVPLLYAHWEGFVKCASISYLRFVSNQKLKYEELSDCFIVFGAKRHLDNLANSKKSEVNIAAVRFFLGSLGQRANLRLASAVNTESNLSSTVFENIALSLGIDPSPYRPRFNLIDESLLDRRNHIAHGEFLDLGADDFRQLSEEVTLLMRCYKNDVLNAASSESYRR
jgi:hypothetical protein